MLGWILLGPLVGLLAGAGLRRVFNPGRRVLLACLAVLFVAVVGIGFLSTLHPGPSSRYAGGTFAWIVREWMVRPGNGLILAIPVLVAAIGAAWPAPRYQGVITGGLAAYGLMPPLALVLVFSSCQYAGVCF